MRFFKFIYNFVFIDSRTNQLSHTHFFSVLSSVIMCIMFPYAVIVGSSAGFDLWLVFGVCFLGNHTLNKIAEGRFANKIALAQPPKVDNPDKVM